MDFEQMTALRVSKCSHIFCWPCVLQYMAYQKDNDMDMICPLCQLPIYKHELKSV
jgi:hypothetical protein